MEKTNFQDFSKKYFKLFLVSFFTLGLLVFSFAPRVSFGEEGVAVTSGDAQAEANIENTINSNVTTPEGGETTQIENGNGVAATSTLEVQGETGSNTIETTAGDASVQSGDAEASANLVNVANTNIIESEGWILLLNIFSAFFEDLDLRNDFSSFSCPGPCSIFSPDTTLQATSTNQAQLINDVVVRAASGENIVSSPEGQASVLSGSANAAANVLNLVNTNIVGSNYLLLAFNNFGAWKGDLVFPSKYFFQALDSSSIPCCQSNLSNSEVSNENLAIVENEVSVVSESGSNQASSSAQSLILTGEAHAQANLLNQVNTNIFGSDSFLVAIRFFGDWKGNVFSAPDWISWQETPSGILLFSNGNASSGLHPDLNSDPHPEGSVSVSNQNLADVKNRIQVFALTGRNRAEAGESALVETGQALAAANVLNIVNTNVFGRNWILALVNIFGDWRGNVAFGRPNLWVGGNFSNVPNEIKPGSKITYNLTVLNRGDTDATRVRLYDRFNPDYVRPSEGAGRVEGERIWWDLGTLKPGEARELFYELTFQDNLPVGHTALENTSYISSFEEDGASEDNVERTQITVFRARQEGVGAVYIPSANLALQKTHTATSTILAGGSADYKLVLKNQDLGSAYEVVLEDKLYYATSSESFESRSWNLGEVFGLEEITVTYTVQFSEDAPRGVYRNVAQARGLDRFGNPTFSAPAETYVEIESIPEEPVVEAIEKPLTGIENLLENATTTATSTLAALSEAPSPSPLHALASPKPKPKSKPSLAKYKPPEVHLTRAEPEEEPPNPEDDSTMDFSSLLGFSLNYFVSFLK